MGIGCVVFLWIVLGAIVAVIASVVLGLITRRWLLSATVPFVLLAYGVVAFSVYAIWCESVRKVDPGLGDYWRAPLAGGYSLVMIDVPEQAFIEARSKPDANLPVSSLFVTGRFIAAEDRDGTFLIDTATGAVRRCASRMDLDRELGKRGVGPARLEPPSTVYAAHRWTGADAAAGLVILLVPVAVLFATRRFWRRPDNSSSLGP